MADETQDLDAGRRNESEPSQGAPNEAPTPPSPTGRPPLSREERELWTGRGSSRCFLGRWVLWAVIVILLLVGGAGLREQVHAGWPLWIALGVALLSGAAMLVKMGHFVLSKRYRLTTQRLFIEEGILVRTTNQTDLIRVNDVAVRQTLFGRILDVGDVTVDCPTDVSNPKVFIRGILHPNHVAEHIHREMRSIRDRKSLVMEAT